MSVDMKTCGLCDVLLPRCSLEGQWTTTKTFSGNCHIEGWKRKPHNEDVRFQILNYECQRLL